MIANDIPNKPELITENGRREFTNAYILSKTDKEGLCKLYYEYVKACEDDLFAYYDDYLSDIYEIVNWIKENFAEELI